MNDKLVVKQGGLASRLAKLKSNDQLTITKVNRLGIIFDDSGSMSGEPIKLAHDAIDEFVKSCNRNDTNLALYPLNAAHKSLTSSFADIAIYGIRIPATGGTPLYSKLTELLTQEDITRAVAFSDGQPGDRLRKTECLSAYKEKGVPVDAVFIGSIGNGDAEMKEIAEVTGGIYMHFTDASVLAKGFKYLAPAYRGMLMSAEFKAKVERGEV